MTAAAPKKKRSIKDEVSTMINQLRADLDSLLKLNRNLAGFKTKVKSKVESFFGRISSTIDSQVTCPPSL